MTRNDETITIDWPHGLVTLRPERPDDVLFRYGLFLRSRLPEWDLVPLAPEARDALMRQQFHAQTVSYEKDFPNARFDIVELNGEAIGRFILDRDKAYDHIVDQAIVPEQRNRGIGTAIMRHAMAQSEASGKPMRLEVAHVNDPCIGLYHRLGFRVIEEHPLYLQMEWPTAEAAPSQA